VLQWRVALATSLRSCPLSWAQYCRDQSQFGQQAKLLASTAKSVDAQLGLDSRKACVTHERKRDFLALGVPRVVRGRRECRRYIEGLNGDDLASS